VQTIFPEEKINAVVLGSLIRIMTAANRFGLYSAFRARIAMLFKSNFPQSRSTVATKNGLNYANN
jgi:hypothetical protein